MPTCLRMRTTCTCQHTLLPFFPRCSPQVCWPLVKAALVSTQEEFLTGSGPSHSPAGASHRGGRKGGSKGKGGGKPFHRPGKGKGRGQPGKGNTGAAEAEQEDEDGGEEEEGLVVVEGEEQEEGYGLEALADGERQLARVPALDARWVIAQSYLMLSSEHVSVGAVAQPSLPLMLCSTTPQARPCLCMLGCACSSMLCSRVAGGSHARTLASRPAGSRAPCRARWRRKGRARTTAAPAWRWPARAPTPSTACPTCSSRSPSRPARCACVSFSWRVVYGHVFTKGLGCKGLSHLAQGADQAAQPGARLFVVRAKWG